MTDIISRQPEEILIKILLMVGYQNNLPFISKRFCYITQLLDFQQINKLNKYLEYKTINDLQYNPIRLINDYLKKTFILGPVYNYYNFNILDIQETLCDIEHIKKYEVIRGIKNIYKMSVNDITKIFNLVITNIEKTNVSIVKKIYQQYFELSCMLILIIDDLIWIINYIKNNITQNDLKMFKISELSSEQFSSLNNEDYKFYYKQLLINIEKVLIANTLFIYNNRLIIGKRLNQFNDMIKKSENFNYHLIILKMI